MNSHYSEDIAWGPLTLKEIKNELEKKPKIISSRQTDGHINYSKTEMYTTCNTSTATSGCFTPDESLQPENKNEKFLEKLSKVIEGDDSYATKPPNDTTISKTEFSDYSSESENDVIVISDTSSDESSGEPAAQCSKPPEISVTHLEEHQLEELALKVISESYSQKQLEESNPEEPVIRNVEVPNILVHQQSESEDENSLSEDTEIQPQDSENEDLGKQVKQETGDSLNKSRSFNFDDTIEEIEMALRQGLNYVMPGEERPTPTTDVLMRINEKPNFGAAQTGTIKKKVKAPTTKKYDYVKSLVGDYIRTKSPCFDNKFKPPLKPPKPPLKTPRRSPLVPTTYLLKNIVSPVGIYIKNRPEAYSKKVKALPELKTRLPTPLKVIKSNKENVASGLPETAYKSAKKKFDI